MHEGAWIFRFFCTVAINRSVIHQEGLGRWAFAVYGLWFGVWGSFTRRVLQVTSLCPDLLANRKVCFQMVDMSSSLN